MLLNRTASPGSVGFAPRLDLPTGVPTWSVALADLNGDGTPDVVALNGIENKVLIFLNTTGVGDSAVTFAQRIEIAVEAGPFTLAIGDVTGDGKLDVVVGHFPEKLVTVLVAS